MKDLTIIIPAKKEAESLPLVINSIDYLDCQIVVSLKENDLETINSVKNKRLNFLSVRRWLWQSLTEAITNCKTKYFCIFNADGSFDHNDILKMYKIIENNDFVYTTRYTQPGGSEDDTIITLIGNKIFSFLGKILFSLNLNDILYTYLMGKTESFKKLNITSNDFRFCVELPIKMEINKMDYRSIPSFEKKELPAKKVNNFKDGFLILLEMLKLFFYFKIIRKKHIDK